MHSSATYKIDGAIVTVDEFNRFLKTLKEIPHSWFCREKSKEGKTIGTTGYDAEDAFGQKYEYRAETSDGTISTISKALPPLKPKTAPLL